MLCFDDLVIFLQEHRIPLRSVANTDDNTDLRSLLQRVFAGICTQSRCYQTGLCPEDQVHDLLESGLEMRVPLRSSRMPVQNERCVLLRTSAEVD